MRVCASTIHQHAQWIVGCATQTSTNDSGASGHASPAACAHIPAPDETAADRALATVRLRAPGALVTLKLT
jgi:hypothetical protein